METRVMTFQTMEGIRSKFRAFIKIRKKNYCKTFQKIKFFLFLPCFIAKIR